jgi:phosphoribosylanthranilate isomerase
MRIRVMIGGLTRPEDLALAARLGADAVGFELAPGPRDLAPLEALNLSGLVPPWVSRVGVFAAEQRREAPAIAEACRLDTLWLLGEPDPGFCAYFKGRFTMIQALDPAGGLEALQARLEAIAPHVHAVAIDLGKAEGLPLSELASPVPLIVSGVAPDTLPGLLSGVRPWGVAASGGVEVATGQKDPALLEALFRAVAGA